MIAEADRRTLVAAAALMAIVLALAARLALRPWLGPALAMRPLGALLARLGVTAFGLRLTDRLRLTLLPRLADRLRLTMFPRFAGRLRLARLPGLARLAMFAGLTRFAVFPDRKSTRLNSSHLARSRMPSSA